MLLQPTLRGRLGERAHRLFFLTRQLSSVKTLGSMSRLKAVLKIVRAAS
jgi:hypothetical protein